MNVESVIQEMERKIRFLEDQVGRIREGIAILREIYGLNGQVEADSASIREKTVHAGRQPSVKKPSETSTAKVKAASVVNPSRRAQHKIHATRPGKSGYKGVNIKLKADGTPRYEANARVNGKFTYLGIYPILEQAAAVAAEARGEKELASELYAKVEQIENNPDRPPKKRRGPCRPETLTKMDKPKSHVYPKRIPLGGAGTDIEKTRSAEPGPLPASMTSALETYYECADCGAEYTTAPKRCTSCDGEDFEKYQRPMRGEV